MPEKNEEKKTGKNDKKPNEPILTLGQWLLIIATLIATAIVGNLIK
ncbi:MAG TPA: hypothetical protein VKA70_18815 [Blastocatellia bacterium]|nr:hypothetical protein [Blastocatellia bacterium]